MCGRCQSGDSVNSEIVVQLNTLWCKCQIHLRTEIWIYEATVRSLLIYESKTYTMRYIDAEKLEVFECGYLLKILGLLVTDGVSK